MSQCKCKHCTFTSEDIAGYIRRLLGQEDIKGESDESVAKDPT